MNSTSQIPIDTVLDELTLSLWKASKDPQVLALQRVKGSFNDFQRVVCAEHNYRPRGLDNTVTTMVLFPRGPYTFKCYYCEGMIPIPTEGEFYDRP
jgi:hypothetical protein